LARELAIPFQNLEIMKRFRLFGLVAIITGLLSLTDVQKSQAQYSINFQVFYDQLSPYGYWMPHPTYGYVWMPQAGPNFRPYYSEGNWIYTQSGWFWNSNYNWGWATFHYGNWTYDNYYGWLWIPGYDWAPAWVTWGSYGGNYGWAPMAPNYGYNNNYYPPVNHWCFVSPRYLGHRHWFNHHYVGYGNNIHMGNNVIVNNVTNITIINNNTYYGHRSTPAGPPKMEIERASGSRITAVNIRESSKPGVNTLNSNQVNVYRPSVAKTNTPAKPSQLVNLQNGKPAPGSTQTIKGNTPQNTLNLSEQGTRNNPGQRQQYDSPSPNYNRQPGYQPAAQPNTREFGNQEPSRVPQASPSSKGQGKAIIPEQNRSQSRNINNEGSRPSPQKASPSQAQPQRSNQKEAGKSDSKLKR
jgi:hypothetical protein